MQCKELFQQMSRYNRWMNANLYDAVGQLSSEQLVEDRGAFFGSVLGTLNHILARDSVWMKRFLAAAPVHTEMTAVQSVPTPQTLSDLLYVDLHELWAMRQMIDEEIIGYIEDLSEAKYDTVVHYTNSDGSSYNKKLGYLLMHFHNHQTHHRGQLTTLLFQMGVDVGVTDIHAILPNADL